MRRRDGEAFLARISFSTVDGQTDGASNYVAQFSDATEKKRAEETIWRHANFDLVTQLPNRRLFTEKLQAVISRSQSSPTRTVVVFVDLDRFKDVNDRFGHQVGDLLLHQAAGRIKACVRATDLVARLGGDEFTVMLADVSDLIGAERVAQEIILALARPYRLDGELVFNSASLGITVFPDDGSDVETLLRNADQAMHAAKRSGRNRLQYFAAGLRRMNTARAGLANDLHAALANDELDLHYQPIVDLATGRMFKAEALARWRHPKRGSVPPDEFIPIAEETGLIVEISDWAFRRATAQALEWRRRFDPAFQISVNVFAAQLLGLGDAAAYFGELVGGPGLDRGAVIIEITESVLLDASQAVRRLFQGYREAGIEIALDDFGTGYSSLAYLKDFEINYLKIDRAFVSNLTERSRDLVICEAVVAMAHKLGIRVVAEGVETEAQRTLLASADCDFAQGYFYARPLSATDFEATVFTTTMKAVG